MFIDINGVEIKAGQKVTCYPSNEIRHIRKSTKPWLSELQVFVEDSCWSVNEERAKKIEVR